MTPIKVEYRRWSSGTVEKPKALTVRTGYVVAFMPHEEGYAAAIVLEDGTGDFHHIPIDEIKKVMS